MRPDGLVHSDGPAILAGTDAPSLQVPDGFDIFSAQYSRDGDDLVIAAEGSPPLTVIDYFTVDSPPGLAMPDGPMLTGDIVELLAGPRAPGQYAQADAPVEAPGGAEAIGQVETLSGSSTATRVSGETVELSQGDPVFQGDVIQTAGDSTLGLRLEDGTLASMSSQSRLVLNEFVYETGSSDNWMLVNLVEGAFAFLTGAIAPSGGMEITTPVAVMAIRGTMPVAFITGAGSANKFFAASDEDYELLHLTTREILAVISSGSAFSLSSPDGPLEAIELDPATLDEIDGLLDVLNDAAAELGLLGGQDGSSFHTHTSFGSIDGGNIAALVEFLLLLDGALPEDVALEVDDPDQFLMAEAALIALPDQAATDEVNDVVIDVLNNDSHPDNDDLTVVFANVPNGQGSVTVVDGQFLVFDPGTDFDYLALGETTDVVITYVVSDSTGAVASSTATVTLTGINQAPVIAPVGQTGLDEQTDTQPLEATIAVTFTDVDLNNIGHDAAIVGVAVSGEDAGLALDDAALMALVSPGTVTKNAGDNSGSVNIDFTAPSSVFDYLAEGEVVTLTYTLEIDDGDGGTTLQTFDVVMTGTNDVPVVSGVSTGAVTEDATPATLTTGGALTIADPDAGESNFAPQTNVAGTYGSFTLLANGTWSYSADNTQAAIQSLGTGDTLTDSFTAVSSDGTVNQTVTVTIHGINDVATITGKATGSVEEDVTIKASGTLTASDVDNGENVFLAVSPAALIGVYGSFSFNEQNGQWSYTLNNGADNVQSLAAGEKVTDTLVVTSLDGTDSQTITVTITGTADDATITGTATGTVTEDGASDSDPSTVQTVNGTLTVSDPDSGEDVFQAVSNADLTGTYGTFSFDELTGQWSYTLSNNAANVQALGAGQKVTDTLVVTSLDGSVSKNISVTVVGSNDKPVVSVGQGDADAVVLTADEATPTSILMDIDSGDPIYTPDKLATVTFFISREEGQPPEQVTVEFLMAPSHVSTLANLITAINAADNGLTALNTHNAFQFTLFVDGGALDLDDLSAVFTNPHIDGRNEFDLGVLEIIEQGTDAEGVSATGTLTVTDVDAVDVVNASVVELAVSGSGKGSLPDGLDADALLSMMSVDTNPVIASGDTGGSIAWSFDSGDEAFGFLDSNESLVLIYTIAATDSAGAVTEHEVTITINGAGSELQLLASSSDLESSSTLMSSTETIDGDSGGEVFVLTETDLSMDEVIIDYQEGDVIDLTRLGFELATGQFTADAAGEFVAYDSADGVLSVDVDGAGGAAEFEAAAEFVTPPPSVLVRLTDGDATADIEIA